MSRTSPILIAGPTASGKSALALRLAEELGGAVINADSMQVYRELRILTARPAPAEEARAPHLLYGHVPAQDAYSTGRFVEDAKGALADCSARGLRPIFTGGTGLYFKALLEGLSPIPPIDEAVRAHWRGEAERRGAAALYADLVVRDPAMAARLDARDTQRIVRALEVLDSSGRSLSHWQSLPGTPVMAADVCKMFVVATDRATLHGRADARFDRMMQEGALDEVRGLAAKNLSPELPAMRALGVMPLLEAIQGKIDIDLAVARAKAETRQYIKRQETWLRRYMIAWNVVSAQEMETNMGRIIAFIQS